MKYLSIYDKENKKDDVSNDEWKQNSEDVSRCKQKESKERKDPNSSNGWETLTLMNL